MIEVINEMVLIGGEGRRRRLVEKVEKKKFTGCIENLQHMLYYRSLWADSRWKTLSFHRLSSYKELAFC